MIRQGFVWSLAAGVLFCAASGSAARADMLVDSTGCLHVNKTGPAENCTTKKSLSVDLTNTCSVPIRAQLCLRGADHLWVACESRLTMAPKDHLFQFTCDSDGDYTFWGCAHFSDRSGNCGGNDLVGKATNTGAASK